MEPRYLMGAVRDLCLATHKIALVSGPRQAGKTTLGQLLLATRRGSYGNWDDPVFRRQWTKDPRACLPPRDHDVPLLVLDELHKARAWKRTLKGLYDTLPYTTDLMVTGSARLNVYRKGGDSLLGRAFHFRMHPFSLGELEGRDAVVTPNGVLHALQAQRVSFSEARQQRLERLWQLGGFPEPYLRGDARFAQLWRRSRLEKVIREDLRDLSRVPELSRVEMLAALLPERVASRLSHTSLREDLEVSLDTVRRWLAMLEELYYLHRIRPWTKRIARSLRQDAKLYLWDWSEVDEEGARFENLVANHLLKACDYWSDTGEGDFRLHYLRTKEQQEIDFLIVRNAKPWLMVEAKLHDERPSRHFARFAKLLPNLPMVQVILTPRIWRHTTEGTHSILVASASELLSRWV